MTAYALVHGAWHGAWCWDLLAAELRGRGHTVVAVDLPCDDPVASIHTNAELVAGAVRQHQDVVLVGHSLGGLTIPVVADRCDVVRHLVFLAAFVPMPGRSLADMLAAEPELMAPEVATFGTFVNADGASTWKPESAVENLYHDCDPELAAWAASMLRPQSWTTYGEPCPIPSWPDLPCTLIACRDDHVTSLEWQQRTARERLRTEPVCLPGSHSPMLSRPAELADVLEQVG